MPLQAPRFAQLGYAWRSQGGDQLGEACPA